MGILNDKVAVVIGASMRGNMGEAIARQLGKEGAHVIVAGRRADAVDAVARDLGATGSVCDVVSDESVARLAQFAMEKYGRVDIGVNCAGVAVSGDFQSTTSEDLKQAINVHLCGTFHFLKQFSGVMEGPGSLVSISSITAFKYSPGYVAYQATKAAADNLVRNAAVEFGPRGIRVNSVVPAFTDTPMTHAYVEVPGLAELFEKEIPLGRLNTVEDVAHTVTWLCQDQTYVTGQAIHVSGGNHLLRLPSSAEMATLG